jgi:hypothetical protein
MTNAARVITAASAVGAGVIGRSADAWRNDFALAHFGAQEGVDFSAMTANKKAAKPVFEVHERETGKREYQLTLMRRSNANKLSEVSNVRVGMFGKLLDRPAAPAPAEEAPAEEVEA